MLSKKDNFLETIRGGKPDRFVKSYEAIEIVGASNPIGNYLRKGWVRGADNLYDEWGVKYIWPLDEPGRVPDPFVKKLTDITEWEEVVKIPDLIANCSADEAWEPVIKEAEKVDRNEKLVSILAGTGVFEQLHYLMGFEDTLCNVWEEPELMQDLAMAIGEYRYKGFKLFIDHVHPDLFLSHDDWGAKNNLFMDPDSWREIIKPAYVKAYDLIHDNGIIIMHHADSFCEQIVEDMVDLHIDVWQGVLPQNDILKIQKILNGRMALQGGIDAAIVDRDDSTEEEIRAETRRCCETYAVNGYFIPGITYGSLGTIHEWVEDVIADEIGKCSDEFFGK